MNIATQMEAEIQDQITVLVNCIRDYQETLGQRERELQTMKCKLASLLEEHCPVWEDEAGYAAIVAETTRQDFNTAALNALIARDPQNFGWLKDYRMTMPIPSRLVVR